MVITDFLEKNARLAGDEVALVEINPSEERDNAVTWRDFSLIENTRPDLPYRRELTWAQFDTKANRFANLLLSRGIKRGTKVGILLMNCLEWLPIYFGILKAGCLAVPLNFRYSSEEIAYCLDLADVEVLVFGPEFTGRIEPLLDESGRLGRVRTLFYVGSDVPAFAESYRELVNYCAQSAPPVVLEEDDHAAIY
ncbi:MAG: AMP-binding protein, partial [Mailhella sp.]|nr:AMP-binding protein [Mailhella sp.]